MWKLGKLVPILFCCPKQINSFDTDFKNGIAYCFGWRKTTKYETSKS
jgi:hypothetical protein